MVAADDVQDLASGCCMAALGVGKLLEQGEEELVLSCLEEVIINYQIF